ncbi:hypothetical protein BC834DRAFT_858270 [Gloeopeniophorella convolvens]|nr:hypothetical protein BC834DRAFT_858270 [Gloeopeniophorella convolvens]
MCWAAAPAAVGSMQHDRAPATRPSIKANEAATLSCQVGVGFVRVPCRALALESACGRIDMCGLGCSDMLVAGIRPPINEPITKTSSSSHS